MGREQTNQHRRTPPGTGRNLNQGEAWKSLSFFFGSGIDSTAIERYNAARITEKHFHN